MKKYSSKSTRRTEMIHINTSKIPACTFCGSTEQGEQFSSCKKRQCLMSFIIEYILGSGQNGLTYFLHKMEYTTMFEPTPTMPRNIIDVGENSISRKSLLIEHGHKLYLQISKQI